MIIYYISLVGMNDLAGMNEVLGLSDRLERRKNVINDIMLY